MLREPSTRRDDTSIFLVWAAREKAHMLNIEREYNLCNKIEGTLGMVQCEETKEKLGLAERGRQLLERKISGFLWRSTH